MKKYLKEIYPYIVIIITVVLIRTFIVTPVRVDGKSMYSTLDNGDILILNKMSKNYNRFDIVVVKIGGSKIVKRIIGLPGDKIEYINNELFINEEKIEDKTASRTGDFSLMELYGYEQIPDNYYFVMGDNRGNSMDSRDYRIGLIKKSDIVGKTKIRIFPLTKIGKFN